MRDIKKKYVKSSSARERPTLCQICYQDVVTHFPRHPFRHHQDHMDVKLVKNLKPGSSEHLALISALRKHLTTEKAVVNPVRSSKDPNTEYFVCTLCL
ncbi:hypothetical protein NQ314_019471 [Rhamnusium bicolor]|uniref:Uncharacterized protein n=1 Tax=Rhamnusium bicolor TaxID=1586634 RepID=A0AAV8WP15_9CUCU|nr:hypothetical protein NQ314_019471 [Rhamnusium bicolor]